MIASLFGPDLGYVVIIVLVVLVGGSQLPKLARNIGTAGKEFRKAQHEAEEEAQRQQTAQPRPDVATAPALRSVSAGSPNSPEEPVSLNLSRAEFDAVLKAREDQMHQEAAG